MRVLRSYLWELCGVTVARVLFLVDVVGTIALVAIPHVEDRLAWWVWASIVGGLAFFLANFELYRRYAPASPLKSALAGLASEDPSRREAAVDSLAKLKGRDAREQLRRSLGSGWADVRQRAALNLAKTGEQSRRLRKVLAEVAQSANADESDRGAAIQALGETGRKAVVPVIQEGLYDPVLSVRMATVDALCKIGGKQASAALGAALYADDSREYQGDFFTHLVSGLLLLDGQGLTELVNRSEDRDGRSMHDLRIAVRVHLAKVEDIPERLRALWTDGDLPPAALTLLAVHPSGAPVLSRVVQSTAPTSLRYAAVRALQETPVGRKTWAGLLGGVDQDARHILLDAVDPSPFWPDSEALELADAIRPWIDKGPVADRLNAIKALAGLQANVAIPWLTGLAEKYSEPEDLRHAAVKGLCEIGTTDSVNAALGLALDRPELKRALSGIRLNETLRSDPKVMASMTQLKLGGAKIQPPS
jgi:HEAT repeat protein